ncbi:molybdate-binding periplasmic protein precursor [Oxobacter pfennigii]|uniref:Molybdate-binding periplasmic protein n=1 Tax=Oxobacter pfennigii TaxID=36849 RepID=A0A0P8WEI8_9CLOT|nr:molybdate ABC transporter substrate-binding protein [Oxobacter pfennigii]KPU46153.1 molybdate-binding periplasmic protein precursor [Oxobacter pfennigii]
MKNLKKIVLSLVTIALLVLMVACGQSGNQHAATPIPTVTPEPTQAAEPVNLTVSAAASLTDAMEEIKAAYINENPNVTIDYIFASSGSLQQQIENGAEVDVFLSAAVKQMDALKNKGLLIDETRKDFLENKVVLIVPKNSTSVTGFKDLTSEAVKQIGLGEPTSVPVGQYSEEILKNLNLLDSIKSKVVYGKDVREVLTWVETSNADAGMVYETDAKISDKVKIVAHAPEGSHVPVYYPAAVIKASKNVDAATDFVNFLYSEKAKPIFEKYGFAFMVK